MSPRQFNNYLFLKAKKIFENTYLENIIMEEFKKKLEIKIRYLAILCCTYPIILAVSKRIFKNASDFSQGVVFGACVGSIGVCILSCEKLYGTAR